MADQEVGTANNKIENGSWVALLYQQFISHITSGSERRGQAWMNALSDVSPELYKQISGTDADCFYDDRKLDAFKRAVFKEGE